MAQYRLGPTGDLKSEATEVPAGTVTSRWDGGANQPTDLSASSEYVEHTAANQTSRVDVGTQTLAAGETVACARVWVYVQQVSGGRAFDVDVFITGVNAAARTSYTASDSGWVSTTCPAPLTQTQVDALAVSVTSRDGAGQVRFKDSAYIDLFTRTDIWDAANAKMRSNRSASTGLSIAAGAPLGTDIGPSVDLGAGRSLFYGGDASVPTDAGQQHWFGTNPANAAAPRATFVRNIALTLSSYEVEAATFAWFTGASNAPYHPDDATYGGRWPFKSFIHSGRLFTVGRFSTFPFNLVWIAYTDDFSGTPDTWDWTYLDPIPAFCGDRGNAEFGVWDDGVDKVYMWSHGPSSGPNTVSLCRVDTTEFHDANWRRPEWWTGSGWSFDKSGFITTLPPGVIGRKRPRGNLYPVPAVAISNQGSVHRRASDDKFQLTGMDDWAGGAIDDAELRCAVTSGTTPGAFGAWATKYTVPEGERFVYGPAVHPQLTWFGQEPDEQVWTYASNFGGQGTWAPLYFSRFVKALSIT